jgi:hypothetical protein
LDYQFSLYLSLHGADHDLLGAFLAVAAKKSKKYVASNANAEYLYPKVHIL